jgi:hypothetical protein
MGILDRLKSLVTTARDAVPADLRGPLRLSPGDAVGWYREKWAVAGVRRVDGQGQVVWHYCLRARGGDAAVLAVEEGTEPTLWLERPADLAAIPWDRDVLEGIAEEPFKLSSHGRAEVAQVGDTPAAHARHVDFRQFEDAAADRTVLLEDWQGHREARVGEIVHEAELTFVRAAETGGVPADFWADPATAEIVDRGSPSSAAHALTQSHDDTVEPPSTDIVREDLDPTAFDDEEWEDGDEGDGGAGSSGPLVEAVVDSEDDEWLAAARYIRDNGIPADPRR